MIKRIELTNFMSHAKTVIEPAAGLTVLVGPNNVGKSAIVAALQILCHNDNSTYVMRHGERECSVIVHTDDGHVVEWRRKNSPSYVIDGQTFDRLSRGGIPAELHQALRLARVDAADDADFDIHFGTQKAPIFLLSSSAANAARFFASSSDAIRLVEVQKRHKEKLAQAQGEKKRLEAESRQINAELEHLEPIVEVHDRLETAEQQFQELVDAEQLLTQTTATADLLETRLAELKHVQTRAAALKPLIEPPRLPPLAPLETLIEQLDSSTRDVALLTARVAALVNLNSPPAQHDVQTPAQLATQIERVAGEAAAVEARRRAFGNPAPPPALADTDALERLVGKMVATAGELESSSGRHIALESLVVPPQLHDETALRKLHRELLAASGQAIELEDRLGVLSRLTPPAEPVDTGSLEAFVARCDGAVATARTCERERSAVEKELAKAERELRDRAAETDCPACGRPLDPDQVLSRAAAGLGVHAHE
jgi:exonuclease SbcC